MTPMIVASYEYIERLGLAAVIFLDTDSGECFQIHRSDDASTYEITTGVGAPVADAITQWRRVGDRFEFALTPTAARLCGGADVLSFIADADQSGGLDDVEAHIRRLMA